MLRREWTDDPRPRVVFSSVPLPFSGLFVSRTRQRGTITHTGGRAGSESIGKSSHRIPTTIIIIIRGWWWTAAAAATPPGECVKTARRTLGVTQHRQVIAQNSGPSNKAGQHHHHRCTSLHGIVFSQEEDPPRGARHKGKKEIPRCVRSLPLVRVVKKICCVAYSGG